MFRQTSIQRENSLVWAWTGEDEDEDITEDGPEFHDQDNVWSQPQPGPWGAAWIAYLDRHHISESSLRKESTMVKVRSHVRRKPTKTDQKDTEERDVRSPVGLAADR